MNVNIGERSPRTRVKAVLRAVLPSEVTLDVEQCAQRGSTFAVVVTAGRTRHRFVAGWAGEGWPADVDSLLESCPDVVVARDLSVGSRDRLDALGVDWVDEVGRAKISLPSGLVVMRQIPEGRPAARRQPGWSSATVATAEAVLTGIVPRVDAVQDITGLSRGAVANALSFLESQGFLDRARARGPGSGRRLGDAPGLLDAYAAAASTTYAKARPVLLHRLWRDPLDALVEQIAPSLNALGVPWVVSGAAAGQLLAPVLSNMTIVEIYLDADLAADNSRLCDALGARVVDRGHRIEIRALPSRVTCMTGTVVDGVRCAPAVRVYADLLAKAGRSAEAAHHLREVLHVADSAQSSGPPRSRAGPRTHRSGVPGRA